MPLSSLISSLILLSLVFSCQPSTGKESFGKEVTRITGNPLVVFQDQENRYWFGGAEEGVYLWEGKTLWLFSTADGLISHSVIGIQEDSNGNIFFDTQEGVSRFDGEQFSTLPIAPEDSANNKWVLEPDDLWFRIGWNSDGPFRYDGQQLYPLQFPPSPQEPAFFEVNPNASFTPYGIYNIYQDKQGSVWFGTSSLGVCRFDGQTVSWLYEESMTITPEGGSLGIRSTLEDQNGDFWFTHTRNRYEIALEPKDSSGYSLLDYQRKEGVSHNPTSIGDPYFPYYFSIVEDQSGDLWMAAYDEGVWCKRGDQLFHYPMQEGGNTGLAFSVYVDRQGQVWVTTRNMGIFRWNGQGFTSFSG